MPDIKLGPTGSETTLPKGVRVEVLVTVSKNIKKAEMSDGSFRYGFFKQERKWTLPWKPLSLSDIQILIDLCALNQILHFQNEYEDNTWYDVIITNFSYKSTIIAGVEKYIGEMFIEESV